MRACVLVPAYDNGGTVGEVVRAARALHPEVLVVDDGSRDGSAGILAGIDGIELLTHERNRGKGAALRTGFERARALGYSHAITLDADGQHPPEEIPRLLDAARGRPDTLWLGARDLVAAGAGPGSRFGCRNSNFWTWVETGLRLPDTQSGLRCYPLAPLAALRLRTTGYDFEIEVLVKAAWTGVPIDSLPVGVRYPPKEERVSHMRPVRDFFRIAWLNSRLVFARLCLPAPFLALYSRRRFHDLPRLERVREAVAELFLREPGSPARIAVSAGLGFFWGIAPVWGFQIALTLLFAHLTGLSKSVAVVASHISFPLAIPAILYASYLLGRVALGPDVASAAAWFVGSWLLAAATAVVGGLLTYLTVLTVQRLRGAR